MMKFKTKLKALAVALAMTAAGSAFAGINDGSSTSTFGGGPFANGNGGLFLEVYDGTGATYIRDLGIGMNSFGTSERPASFTSNVDTGTFSSTGNGAVVGGALTFVADANWTTFATGKLASNFRWEVLATDNTGTSGADQRRVLYTSTFDDQARAAIAGTLVTNAQLDTAIGNIQTQLASIPTGINALIGSNQSVITTVAADVAQATFLGSTLGSGTNPNINTWSTVGTNSFLNYATRSGASNTAEFVAVTYGSASNAFPVALAADGTLTFGQVTAVPEPGTWALMLAGLAMVGGIARRRVSV
jgi:hypothetical protein